MVRATGINITPTNPRRDLQKTFALTPSSSTSIRPASYCAIVQNCHAVRRTFRPEAQATLHWKRSGTGYRSRVEPRSIYPRLPTTTSGPTDLLTGFRDIQSFVIARQPSSADKTSNWTRFFSPWTAFCQDSSSSRLVQPSTTNWDLWACASHKGRVEQRTYTTRTRLDNLKSLYTY